MINIIDCVCLAGNSWSDALSYNTTKTKMVMLSRYMSVIMSRNDIKLFARVYFKREYINFMNKVNKQTKCKHFINKIILTTHITLSKYCINWFSFLIWFILFMDKPYPQTSTRVKYRNVKMII